MNIFNNDQELASVDFSSPDEIFKYYKKVLPERCPSGLQEELGPVFLQKRDDLADLFQKRIFCLGDSCIDMSKKLNWLFAANDDLEWTCTLARHHHLPILAKEYAESGNEIFAQETLEQMLNWIDNAIKPNLPDDAFHQFFGDDYLIVKQSNWRPLETAFRIGETWPEALKILINSNAMSPAIWEKILKSIYKQAEYLSIYRWKVGNHSIMEAAMLAVCCIIFREFKDSQKWLKECVEYLIDSQNEMFYNDAYSREMSGGYRWVMVKGYITLYEVALHNNMTHIFPEDFTKWLHEVSKAEIYHIKPDFSVPVTNETNSGAQKVSQLGRIINVFEDQEVKYVLSRGNQGKKPSCCSHFFKDAKVGIMRSDWTSDALYLSFDMGEKGKHTIGDQLSVDISAYGRNFLSSCGRWRYTTSPGEVEWMDMAKYFKSSAACNTVMPKNATQVLADADGEMQICDEYDYAEGIFDSGYTRKDEIIKVSHQRKVLFVKPFFWIITDILSGEKDDKQEIEQVWHFLEKEKNVNIIASANAVSTNNKDANIIIKQLDSSVEMKLFKGETEKPYRGWQCPEYSNKIAAFELVSSKDGKIPMTFETLIFPVKGEVEEIPEFSKNENEYIVKYLGMQWTISKENNQFKINKTKVNK